MRALCAGGVIAFLGALPAAAGADAPRRWDVTVAVRIEGGTHRQVMTAVALPLDAPGLDVGDVELTGRGMAAHRSTADGQAWAEFRGRARSPRRVAVSYTVARAPARRPLPAIVPVADLDPALVPYVSPAPLFQSRSLLVREFLEKHVGPAVRPDLSNLFQAIFETTRARLKWRRDGRSLTLDVIRRRRGKRIGIERAFVTFLRCAGIPARFVEGVDLDSATRRKRVFWTEVWAAGAWWPASVSRGWIGDLPPSWLGLARDGERVVRFEGPVTATYGVHAHPLPPAVAHVGGGA
jgi:hypothetical protein